MTENKQYFAKSKLANGLQPTVAEHLRSVAQEAVRFGASFGCGDAAQMAGQFHDFGKYSTRFQKVLTGEQTGIDHAFSSAALLYARTQFVPVGVYTIVEVKYGKGSTAGWGRLKSGAGWISLDYTVRV